MKKEKLIKEIAETKDSIRSSERQLSGLRIRLKTLQAKLDPPETWKTIEGFEDYRISDLGKIERVWKKGNKPLKTDKRGRVGLSVNSFVYTKNVAELVVSAFLGLKEGQKIRHKNGNKQDNSVNNLELSYMEPKKDKGVYWDRKKKKYRAHVKINNKTKHLGYFTEKEKAIEAVQNILEFL